MKAILAAVDELQDELVTLLQRLIRIPTVNPPGEAYEEFVADLRAVLDGYGYATEVHRAPTELAPLGEGRPRPNLIGKLAGDGPLIDGVTAYQVMTNEHLTTGELVARMAAAGPRQARWRTERPLLRRMPTKNQNPDGTVETWRMGYVFEVILTRDTWMHRVDVAQATGRPLDLTPGHDGRIVADVVAEWARRHGKPFTLELTGPAGGSYTEGSGGVELTCDAVEFCRTLAGRVPGSGLLAQPVPF